MMAIGSLKFQGVCHVWCPCAEVPRAKLLVEIEKFDTGVFVATDTAASRLEY